MLLVVPAMEIRDGRCVQMVRGPEGVASPDDPVAMARLWRTENAKSLHVTDLDGRAHGRLVNGEVIGRLIGAVDIPVVVAAGFRSFPAIRDAFDLGAYRVPVVPEILEHPDDARRALEEYTSSRVVLGIDARGGMVLDEAASAPAGASAVEVASAAKAMGFHRIFYTEVARDGTPRGIDTDLLRAIAGATGMRITVAGGLRSLDDLLGLQELEPIGVDSVIIGRALYENRFACQGLWRRCEAGQYPYTAKV